MIYSANPRACLSLAKVRDACTFGSAYSPVPADLTPLEIVGSWSRRVHFLDLRHGRKLRRVFF